MTRHVCAGVIATAAVGCAQRITGASDALYPPEVMPAYRLEFEDDDWQDALEAGFDPRACEDKPVLPARLTYENPVSGEDEVFERVGVRHRGHNIYQDDGIERAGFKIVMDAYTEDLELHGKSHINLLGTEGDPTLLRERLATELMREADVPAPRVTHARLWIDGTFQGVFPNSEEADDRAFLRDTFGDEDGSTYKVKGYCGSRAELAWLGSDTTAYVDTYQPKAGTDEADMASDLLPFLQCASEPDDAAFRACLPTWIDVDAWLAEIALDMILPDVDGMASAGQNFLLHRRAADDRFVVIPWDKDQAFRPDLARDGTASLFALEPAWLVGSTPALVRRIRGVFRAEYCARAAGMVDLHDPAVTVPRIDALEDMMRDAVREDPFLNPSSWATSIDALREVVRARDLAVRAELDGCVR
ncbi:MAG: hypothetical protein RLZZ299_1541 [Pseudomonadota bacterium]|jgi:hypothetical protein